MALDYDKVKYRGQQMRELHPSAKRILRDGGIGSVGGALIGILTDNPKLAAIGAATGFPIGAGISYLIWGPPAGIYK